MVKRYNLKLSFIVKLIIDMYLEIKPDPSSIRINTSTYLRPLIYKEINELLNFLDSERKTNSQLQELLNNESNKPVLQLLELNQRLPS